MTVEKNSRAIVTITAQLNFCSFCRGILKPLQSKSNTIKTKKMVMLLFVCAE